MWVAADLAKFGTNPECILTSTATMIVKLGKENRNLIVGSSLSLADGIIRERGLVEKAATYLKSGKAEIPKIEAKLSVTLRNPEKVGGSSILAVRGKVAGAQGCTKLTYEWGLDFSSNQSPDSNAQNKLTAAKAKFKDAEVNEIGGSDLAPGYKYTITLKAINFIGTFANKSGEFEKLTEDIPVYVNLITPSDEVDPQSKILISTPITSEKTLSKLRFTYTVLNSIDFNLEFAKGRKFSINGKKLGVQGGKTYKLGVTVDYELKQGNTIQSKSVTAVGEFKTKTLDLQVIVKGKGKVEEASSIELDGSFSRDPNVADGDLNDAIFKWTCENLNNENDKVCYDVDGNVVTSEKKDSKLSIQGDALGQGNYKFCLLVKKNALESSACKEVEIVTEPPPVIVETEVTQKGRSLQIKAIVESKNLARINWSPLQDDGL